MTRLVFAGRLADDFARIETHLLAHEVGDVQARLSEIVDALQVLTQHPLMGRKVGDAVTIVTPGGQIHYEILEIS